MRKQKFLSLLTLGLSTGVLLAACGNDGGSDTSSEVEQSSEVGSEASANDFTTVMVTDIGGVDDKSFNQSAWEGLQAWGEENGKSEGIDGYNHIVSNSDAEFITNLTTAVNSNFDLVFGVGYKLKEAMQEVSQTYPDTKFAIIDDTIEGENTTSVLFADNEAAFLAGVAAAMTTKTNKVGFVGGIEGVVIDRFEAGFVEGVKYVDEAIEVNVQYVDSFDDAARAKSIASAMYSDGADIIYQAAGNAGNGVFSEARDIVEADPTREIYVVGVDRDQQEEGKITINGEVRDLTLTSTVKGVGVAAHDIANRTMNGDFPSNEVITLGLVDGGVSLTDGVLTEDVLTAVREAEQKVISGEITVSETPAR
ncbi:BMP family lipoprotein [Jeotgalibaca arthritidis]|uniref:BMP family ABC transporter substrate-binding protein n=1 Tax=Jeotgalibaca arthritidis TaxID=1868794 RepID=A0A6G7KBY3_9LACT|nr:BMP family protein [Jeotgalibaca arthritidis]QII82778.1 BMP family ABC transporter substrate-binding protein [Jeotgalibaca arthritidis]